MKFELCFFIVFLLLSSCINKKLCENAAFCAEIDGKKWYPTSSDFKSAELSAHLIDTNNQFWIGAYKGSSTLTVGVVDPVDGIKVGDYVLAGQTCCSGTFDLNGNERFKTDTENKGLLSITHIDRSKKTVSGKFYFKAYNSGTGKVVDVSNGSFNISYVEY